MNGARTLFDKIWSEHVIVVSPQGEDLLYVDFNLINEGQSFLAFDQLRIEGRMPRRPQQHLAVTDHYLPTINRSLGSPGTSNSEIRRVVEMLHENATDLALPHIAMHHLDQGISHVIAPGLCPAQPRMLTTCHELRAGRVNPPRRSDGTRALAHWVTLPTDAGAVFDRELRFDAARLAPMVSWGTSPEDCSPVDGAVPDPSSIANDDRRRHVQRALDYMRLSPSTPLESISIDRVFIGSCTNSRIEDLRAAARLLKGSNTAGPGMVSPGLSSVKRQAESEGLDKIFCEAGLEWRDSGCSMCNGSNGELVAPGERCASTTNRKFEGRQRRCALTHIISPSLVAAAAICGRFTDGLPLLLLMSA